MVGLSVRRAVPVNLAISLAAVPAAFPARLSAVALADLAPFAVEAAALITGAVVAAYLGTGWLERVAEHRLSLVILALLVALGVGLILEGLLGMAGDGIVPEGTAWRAATGLPFGAGTGLVSSLLGVAGGEVIIPVLVLGFGAAIEAAGSLSLLVGLPAIVTGLARYAGAGLLDDRPIMRDVIVPMALGVALIWSAWKSLRHR